LKTRTSTGIEKELDKEFFIVTVTKLNFEYGKEQL